MGAYLELRRGIGEPTFIPLSAGKEMSIGRRGMWRVEGEGVLDVHGYVFFDGVGLFVQSHDPSRPVRVGNTIIGPDWTPVDNFAEIELGAAAFSFILEDDVVDSTDEATLMFDPNAAEKAGKPAPPPPPAGDDLRRTQAMDPASLRAAPTGPPGPSPQRPPPRPPPRNPGAAASPTPGSSGGQRQGLRDFPAPPPTANRPDEESGSTRIQPLVSSVPAVRPAAGAPLPRMAQAPSSSVEVAQGLNATTHAPLVDPSMLNPGAMSGSQPGMMNAGMMNAGMMPGVLPGTLPGMMPGGLMHVPQGVDPATMQALMQSGMVPGMSAMGTFPPGALQPGMTPEMQMNMQGMMQQPGMAGMHGGMMGPGMQGGMMGPGMQGGMTPEMQMFMQQQGMQGGMMQQPGMQGGMTPEMQMLMQQQGMQGGMMQQPGMPGMQGVGMQGMPMGATMPPPGATAPAPDSPLEKFRALSGPRKVSLVLAPFVVFAVFYLLFLDDEVEPLPPTARDAAAASADGGGVGDPDGGVPTLPIVPPQLPPQVPPQVPPVVSEDAAPPPIGPSDAGNASAPIDAGKAPEVRDASVKAPAVATLERRAADAYAEGRLEQAAQLYEELARGNPQDPHYPEIARIIRQRLRGN